MCPLTTPRHDSASCARPFNRERGWRWVGIALLGAWALLPVLFGTRVMVINTSPSVAPGLYVRSSTGPAVGCIVDFEVPPAATEYVRARTGRDGKGWYILKPVIAGPGDRVDTTGEWLIVNGRVIAPMPPATAEVGRALPIWRQARVLGPDEFFVFSNRIPNSFDSRCYGPITRRQIDAVRRPLVTW